MSGGSWDYFYGKLEDVSYRLKNETCSYRKALGKLLLKCSNALHDIEWVDSCDKSPGDEIEAIKKALGKNYKELVLSELIEKAESVKSEIDNLIKEAQNVKC